MAEVTLSVVLSASLCVGLPTVIWAIYTVRRLPKAFSHISAFLVSLLFSDVAELLLTPFVNTRLLEGNPCHSPSPCWVLYSSFAVVRISGLHFHQVVALEGILSLAYPPHPSTHSAHSRRSAVQSASAWIFVIGCNFMRFGYTILLIFCAASVMVTVTSALVTLSVSLADPVRPKRPGLSVLMVALFTLVVLYMPCLVLSCVNYPTPLYDSPGAVSVVSIMSFRLVTDPLLCVLVCRKTESTETHRNP